MFGRIITITRMELLKATRRKFFYIAFIIVLIICLGIIYHQHRLVSAGEHSNAYVAISSCLKFGVHILLVLTIIHSSLLLAQETTQSTLKSVLVRPIRRSEFYIGKLLCAIIVTLIFLIVLFGICYAATFALIEKRNVVDKEHPTFVLFEDIEMHGYLMKSFLLITLSVTAYSVLCLFISSCSENAGFAVGLAFAVFLGLQVLSDPGFRIPLLADFMPDSNSALLSLNYYIGGPIETLSTAANGCHNFPFKITIPGIILFGIAIPVAYILVFGSLGLAVFCRKDILT